VELIPGSRQVAVDVKVIRTSPYIMISSVVMHTDIIYRVAREITTQSSTPDRIPPDRTFWLGAYGECPYHKRTIFEE
jgi:hypothetical protein